MSQKIDSNFIQDLKVGTISATLATPTFFWMITLKVITQLRAKAKIEGKKLPEFSKNPLHYFKGMPTFAASFGPTIALQTAAKGFFGNQLHPIAAAVLAGGVSALIVAPFELITTQQQAYGGSMIQKIGKIYQGYGVQGFARGIVSTAGREGCSSGTILGVVPFLKEKFQEQGFHDPQARAAASLIGGTIGATLSQPFDTRKTRLQTDLAAKDALWKAVTSKGNFSGLSWRILVYFTASGSISYLQEKLKK